MYVSSSGSSGGEPCSRNAVQILHRAYTTAPVESARKGAQSAHPKHPSTCSLAGSSWQRDPSRHPASRLKIDKRRPHMAREGNGRKARRITRASVIVGSASPPSPTSHHAGTFQRKTFSGTRRGRRTCTYIWSVCVPAVTCTIKHRAVESSVTRSLSALGLAHVVLSISGFSFFANRARYRYTPLSVKNAADDGGDALYVMYVTTVTFSDAPPGRQYW